MDPKLRKESAWDYTITFTKVKVSTLRSFQWDFTMGCLFGTRLFPGCIHLAPILVNPNSWHQTPGINWGVFIPLAPINMGPGLHHVPFEGTGSLSGYDSRKLVSEAFGAESAELLAEPALLQGQNLSPRQGRRFFRELPPKETCSVPFGFLP